MQAVQTMLIANADIGRAGAGVAPKPRAIVRATLAPPLENEELHRIRVGRIDVELKRFRLSRTTQFTPDATTLHLVIPLVGGLLATSEDERYAVNVGGVLLLGRHGRVDCAWAAGSSVLVLHVPVTLLQQAIAANLSEPRRLSAANHTFILDSACDPFAAMVFTLLDLAVGGDDDHEGDIDVCFANALIAALSATGAFHLFSISRSLKRAADYLRAHPESRLSADDLARVAGVTLRTLQRNVKTCFGISLARFVDETRLVWVRDRLTSTEEIRSIGGLAATAGYRSASTLGRSYQRLFRETPTETRARAFAAARR